MKKAFLLTLAMLFAFAMPAQATEGYEGFSPVSSFSVAGNKAVVKITDDKVTDNRSARRQLEAAVIVTENKTSFADEKRFDVSAGFQGYGAPYEVGWRKFTCS